MTSQDAYQTWPAEPSSSNGYSTNEEYTNYQTYANLNADYINPQYNHSAYSNSSYDNYNSNESQFIPGNSSTCNNYGKIPQNPYVPVCLSIPPPPVAATIPTFTQATEQISSFKFDNQCLSTPQVYTETVQYNPLVPPPTAPTYNTNLESSHSDSYTVPLRCPAYLTHEDKVDKFVNQLKKSKAGNEGHSSKLDSYRSFRYVSQQSGSKYRTSRSSSRRSPSPRKNLSSLRSSKKESTVSYDRRSRSPRHRTSRMARSAGSLDRRNRVSPRDGTDHLKRASLDKNLDETASAPSRSSPDPKSKSTNLNNQSEKNILIDTEPVDSDILGDIKACWTRSAPADLYYERDNRNPFLMVATKRLKLLSEKFEHDLVRRSELLKAEKVLKVDETMQKSSEQKETSENQTPSCLESPGNEVRPISEESETKDPLDETSNEEKHNCDILLNDEVTEKVAQINSAPSSDSNTVAKNMQDTKGNSVMDKPNEVEQLPALEEEENDSLLSRCLKIHNKGHVKKRKKESDSSESLSDDDSSGCEEDDEYWILKGAEEMERKRKHPDKLHSELWFNEAEQMNDGPICRCSAKARRSGIRHGYYAGEEKLQPCSPWTNNADRLYHYLVTISPPTNFLVKNPTVITHDGHEFIFEGFSLLSHQKLLDIPTCQVIRFNTEYTIFCVEEKLPENYCMKELDLFFDFFFKEILELIDFNVKAVGDEAGCPRFHFMPRFVRSLAESGKEILSMNEVLRYLLHSSIPLILPEELSELLSLSEADWLNLTDPVKGMIVTFPGKRPCSLRVDQIDRDQLSTQTINYPVIVHFGIRPPQLSYVGNPAYQKALKEYVKFRHLLANMPRPTFEDKRQLELKEAKLQEMRTMNKMKKDVTVAVSSQGAIRTGIMCDMVQHALLIPVLVRHLRFHNSLKILEERIGYKFENRLLLHLALTHPSYRENFGTNPDHARNSLTNCGVRQPQYGDRKIHYMNTHKRGINTLINIMSRFGKHHETDSKITHNERLEFLGDAVVEFLTSIHLFHLFPCLEEGGLATYRAAIVQNHQLSHLAEKLALNEFVLRAHGSDLCYHVEFKHAMANCFEALMGAIFIDSSIEEADAVFSATLFRNEDELHKIWVNYNPHPLQEQEPDGDRKWIETFPFLQKMAKFEEQIGIEFRHIRLLARAFTDRSIGFNYLTLGSNQRLEFLGDTVLQLVASEYLYKFFPEHHEGHLSLLRSSLVNNRTQAVVCDDLNMTEYSVHSQLKPDLKVKDRADLLEAFIGSLYIDLGLDYCRTFCGVCFFPRLQEYIIRQDWNDPKSKLQQCCLTLRTMEGGEPDIPVYKVIECKGPTNTRVYTVAVYFRDQRLAKASGHSIQQAEMNAAKEALNNNKGLFPHLAYQRRVIEKNALPTDSEEKGRFWSSYRNSKATSSSRTKEDNSRTKRGSSRTREKKDSFSLSSRNRNPKDCERLKRDSKSNRDSRPVRRTDDRRSHRRSPVNGDKSRSKDR